MSESPDAKPASTPLLGATISGASTGPLPQPPALQPVNITTHRELLAAVRVVAARLAASPEFSPMLAVNPVLALERYGITLTPELQDHVLRSIRHPPAVLARRQALEASLTTALEQTPRPHDSAWLASIVFNRFGLTPLQTAGAAPVYLPSPHAVILQRLEAIRPTYVRPASQVHKGGIRSTIAVAPWSEPARSFDLAAPVPALPPAAAAQAALSLEEAWFYKDANPLVRDLVELGAIMRTGLAFQLPDTFRKIAAGETPNGFRTWFRSIRFPAYEAGDSPK